MAKPYHHGDLAAALVEAGLELARAGGPDAIGLREATRAAGVSPNAAYRHFADREALVLAVAEAAQALSARAMHARLDVLPRRRDPKAAAVDRLRGVGRGYVDFALAEPGLFQLAFRNHDRLVTPAQDDPPPYELLVEALDGLVTAGMLTARRRKDAEWPCWAAVHGVADLATRGPLRHQPPAVVDRLVALVVERAIDGVIG